MFPRVMNVESIFTWECRVYMSVHSFSQQLSRGVTLKCLLKNQPIIKYDKVYSTKCH